MVTELPKQRQQLNDDVSRLTGRHFPALVPVGVGEKENRAKKRCHVCYASYVKTDKGGHMTTIYICGTVPQPKVYTQINILIFFTLNLTFLYDFFIYD